ncbi:DUF4168 domain-containing protein [Sagittula sp. S175]|uniref:DUF4168 domain-containing protein n=1 Tax=Sagittula sp. S175 TaxID=3415129 RepID=UPI003C7A7A48
MTIRTKIIGTATLAALFAAPLAPAFAQTSDQTSEQSAPAPGQPMLQEDMPSQSFTDAQLESFVTAVDAVTEIRAEALLELQIAEPADAETVQAEAVTRMKTAVDETPGMDLATYNAIGAALHTDAELNDRVAALVKTRQSDTNDTTPQGDG